jgi:hypothetical protein
MRNTRDIARVTVAAIGGLAGLGLARFVVYDYVPPEILVHSLERSMFVTAGLRRPAMMVYGALALVMMAVFFNVVQQRWPGRGSVKGLVFGASIGVLWSFGFLAGWAFLETTLRAELLNSVVDVIALAAAGWFIGLAIGRDVPRSGDRMWKPWLAVLLVALGFVVVHALGATFSAEYFTSSADLLLVPTTLSQILLLFGLGVWVGVMFVVLRAGLPFDSTWARVAFFAFGIFGFSWTLFHLFFVIEFAGVLPTILCVGLIGAVGVFAGALAYEGFAGGRRKIK